MKQKFYCMTIFILLNILAIIISVYFDYEIFARRFKEFMWVIDLFAIPFIVILFMIRNEKNTLSETEYLLSSDINARRLNESIKELQEKDNGDKS